MNIQTIGPRNFTCSGGRIRYNPWPEQPPAGRREPDRPTETSQIRRSVPSFDIRSIYLHPRP